jgi:predicted flap endonuclease-1-like 5' DNA nuclease
MNLLFRVVYAAHATGTHHKLALDSLRFLAGPHAEKWRCLFLAHAALYMQGAKAPDDTFKDFCNHVLHVRDGYWGGAPDAVQRWYGQFVDALKGEQWSEAVYAAGVLSHYFVDPIHPFHTAQSEAENNIHRAVEWSISRSYDDLFKAVAALPLRTISIGDNAGTLWLRDLVCRGADVSNKHYESLIAHYNFTVGVVDPPAGLDATARRIVSELINYATHAFAVVLDRAFQDAGVAPPEVDLRLDTVVAVLKVPLKLVLKKLADVEDRRQVEAMYDELQATGRVDQHLPEDDRIVREAHALAIAAPRKGRLETRRQAVVADSVADRTPVQPPHTEAPAPTRLSEPAPKPAAMRASDVRAEAVSSEPASEEAAAPAPALRALTGPLMSRLAQVPPAVLPEAVELASADAEQEVRESVAKAPDASPASETEQAEPVRPEGKPGGKRGSKSERENCRFRLKGTDDVERGPSIGPRMAERLAGIGIHTVDDLLNSDAEGVSLELGSRHVTLDVVRDWQDQARLVMTVPDLRGGHAQLLVGAGYRSLSDLSAADPAQLSADVLAFASTPEGRRVLRDGSSPDIEAIKAIAERARQQAA